VIICNIISLKLPLYSSNVSLHYLVKCQCLKSNNWKQDAAFHWSRHWSLASSARVRRPAAVTV